MLYGIDVSNWQGTVDWRAVAEAAGGVGAYLGRKIEFAITLATDTNEDGSPFVSPLFEEHWRGIHAVGGLVRGAYHYARPSRDPEPCGEVERFLLAIEAAGGLREGDLLALDLEDAGVPVGVDLLSWTLGWLRLVQDRTGVRALVYSRREYLGAHGLVAPELADWPLWIAEYGLPAPPVLPWPLRNFVMWQCSSTGQVPGVVGNCDVDQFFGGREALRALGVPESVADPVVVDRARDFQTAIDVTGGFGRELAVAGATLTVSALLGRLREAGQQLVDVAGILERLRDGEAGG